MFYLASASSVPDKRPKPRLWDDDDLAAFEKMLREHPVLEAPCPSELGQARYRAALLTKELNDRGNIKVKRRIWEDGEGYRWAVVIDGR